ncbi:MAG: type II secretion system F family protein [Desulfobacterales bacterium]|nr:type II secretion system F family protein [Desulfobacterales bacterium]
MPKYTYKALNENGRRISGEIEAESPGSASTALSERGFIPIDIAEKGKLSLRFDWEMLKAQLTQIKAPELILFTKQLKTMLRSGVPILKLLEVLENQTENAKLKYVIGRITQDIREGSSLYDAFRRHPRVFSPLYCSMVQAGEASGALPEILDRLTYITEHEYKVKSDIKSALQYPIIVLTFLIIAFFVLLTFVIPKFIGIFLRAGIDLPVPTQICLLLYRLLSDYWMYLLIGGVGLILFLYYYLRTEQGKFLLHSALMRLPVFGPLFLKAAMSRFSSIFAIFQASGVGVLDAMKIMHGTIGNAAIARELDQINERLEQGRGIAGPLKAARYFPPMVINMVAIGEEAGNLDEMLNEISKHYDDELEYSMKKLSDAVGPILTVGLAAVVGFFALAIFLPMWDLTKMIK